MIHLDRVKGTDLSAEPATHTGVVLNNEFRRRRHHLASDRILRLGDMDHLRRADPLTLVAAGTQLVAALVIEEQHRHIPIRLRHRQTLLGVLDRKRAVDLAEVVILAKRACPVIPDHPESLE